MNRLITTKYHGPTNTTGSRIKAKVAGKYVFLPYDHGKSDQELHIEAATKLVYDIGWGQQYNLSAPALLHDGSGYAFIVTLD